MVWMVSELDVCSAPRPCQDLLADCRCSCLGFSSFLLWQQGFFFFYLYSFSLLTSFAHLKVTQTCAQPVAEIVRIAREIEIASNVYEPMSRQKNMYVCRMEYYSLHNENEVLICPIMCMDLGNMFSKS